MLKREIYLKRIRGFYHSDLIKILVGIRRSGKSILLNQIIDELKEEKIDNEHITYINLEYLEFEDLVDYKKLNSFVESKIIDDKMYYIFIDEIQNVANFEKTVNSLRAKHKNLSIFITGSNSKLLSEELSTILSGRYVSFDIMPFNYKEFIQFTGKDGHSEESFMEFIKWGGLPNVFSFSESYNKNEYLQSVFDSIILRDVVERLGLTDRILFNQILEYIIDTTGREFSANNILNFLKNKGRVVSTKTLYAYVDALCKALIIKKVYRYDVHGKAVLKTLNKFYVTDLGIAKIRNNNFEINKAMTIENVIFNELLLRCEKVYVGKLKCGEIDFIGRKDGKQVYYQISYLLNSDETIKREFSALDKINDNYEKIILSMDKLDFSRNGIKHENIIDWLLKD